MVAGHSLRMKLHRVDYEMQSSPRFSDAAYVQPSVIAGRNHRKQLQINYRRGGHRAVT